jgi:hypothetical protein
MPLRKFWISCQLLWALLGTLGGNVWELWIDNLVLTWCNEDQQPHADQVSRWQNLTSYSTTSAALKLWDHLAVELGQYFLGGQSSSVIDPAMPPRLSGTLATMSKVT